MDYEAELERVRKNEEPQIKRRCKGLFKTMKTLDQSRGENQSKLIEEHVVANEEVESSSDCEPSAKDMTAIKISNDIPTTAVNDSYSNKLAIFPKEDDVIDVLGMAIEDEVKETNTEVNTDGIALLGAYGDSSSSDDEQQESTKERGGDKGNNNGGEKEENDKGLDESIKNAMKTNRHMFKDFDITLLQDVNSRDVNAEWKLNSNLSPEERRKRLSESIGDKTMSGMFTTQTTSGVMKAKHQIGWLAADVFENEEDLRRRGAEARAHKKRAQQRYGW